MKLNAFNPIALNVTQQLPARPGTSTTYRHHPAVNPPPVHGSPATTSLATRTEKSGGRRSCRVVFLGKWKVMATLTAFLVTGEFIQMRRTWGIDGLFTNNREREKEKERQR